MLFMVIDRDRWGYSENVVRAETAEAAGELVSEGSKRLEIIPLPAEGGPAILWCRDESPDSR